MQSNLSNINIKYNGVIFLLLVAIVQFYWIFDIYHIDWIIALTDALASSALIYGLFFFIRYSKSYKLTVGRFFVLSRLQNLLMAVIWAYICRYSLLDIFTTSPQYANFWSDTFFIRGFLTWIILICYSGVSYYEVKLKETENLIQEEKQSSELRKEAELYKLRQQLQPHFLFNSLNSISALIGKEPKSARLMVLQLSDYLRNMLKKEDDKFISLQEELDDLRLYLAIEQVRFGHRLNIEEYIEVDCENIRIPPFLIQPLVENAIKFGLYGTTGMVNIVLKSVKEKGSLLFTITNPFDPNAVTVKGTGFGLDSIRRRLYLLFARNDLLKIEKYIPNTIALEKDREEVLSHNFTATITIPIQVNDSLN